MRSASVIVDVTAEASLRSGVVGEPAAGNESVDMRTFYEHDTAPPVAEGNAPAAVAAGLGKPETKTAKKKNPPGLTAPQKAAAAKRRVRADCCDDVLLRMHLAQYLPCEGGRCKPDVPDKAAHESRLQFIMSVGGTASSKTDMLRTFLLKT